MTKISSYTAISAASSDDLALVVDVDDTTMAATGTDKQVQVGNLLGPTGTVLPNGWNTQWRLAKARAIAGTGTAEIAVIGDSEAAGQSAGVVTDCLTYGWCGRLDSMLAGNVAVGGVTPMNLGGFAEGYTLTGVSPGVLVSPSSPYPSSAPANVVYDGGISSVWSATTNGSTWLTITVPLHPVTGAAPMSIDLLTVDYIAAGSWSYQVDALTAVTITTNGTGVNGTLTNTQIRRTSVTLTGGTTHTVKLVNLNAATGSLIFIGHVAYYSTVPAGLGIFRNSWPGARSIDFATGAGANASSTGLISAGPDHIMPWDGVNNANMNAGPTFPFTPDLAIIQIGGNDCTYGGAPEGMRKAVQRMINAVRRGTPKSSATPGASILMIGEAYCSPYSDNPSVTFQQGEWQRYKQILFDLATSNGCGWIDFQEVFGETPVAQGYMISGQAHPTQNGGGAGGGDGQLLMAQAIAAVL